MSPHIAIWLGRVRRYLPGKIPGAFVVDAAQLCYLLGKESAEFQRSTGILGQTGFGGSGWTPESVQHEYEHWSISSRTI